jgi:hypothetical protein
MAYQSPLASALNYGVVKIGVGIDVTDGVISVSEGTINTTLVQDANSPYAVTATDNYIGVVGTIPTITIDLPTGAAGRELVVKSEFGNTSDIQLTPQSGEFVEGNGAGYVIEVVPGINPSVTLIFRDTNWNVI